MQAPVVSSPKGGGAIRGVGEKFGTNPATGTGSMSIPIATSPGRGGFGPELALSYDSGAGNGPFGFGWSLAIPSITRRTDRGIPEYRDAAESDVYIVSGAEDLVPVLDEAGERHVDEETDPAHVIHRYRPRVEGLFARIERWTHCETGEIHWRSITRDNVTSTYGTDRQSRVHDPDDPRRVFTWLLRRTHDDRGNVIRYEYAAEDDAGVDRRLSNERSRSRGAARYLKRILYGNRTSRLARPDWEADGWLFEVVFDHDEGHLRELPWDPAVPAEEQHHRVEATARAAAPWAARPDPFSSFRAGFEVRMHRRCRRVLMFHHADELVALTGGEPYLVRVTELDYDDLADGADVTVEDELAHPGSTRFASFIRSVTQSGFVLDPGAVQEDGGGAGYRTYLRRSLPPVELGYTRPRIDDELRELDPESARNLPVGLDERAYRWVDLDGEGISGILTEQASAWWYKPNLGGGRFGPMQRLPTRPGVRLEGGGQHLVDLSGDGQLDVVAFGGPTPGFFERTQREDWEPFRALAQVPSLRWDEPNVRLVDLDGDGHADVLVTENEVFTWYRSRGEEGFDAPARVHQPVDEERGPRLILADGTQSIYLADLSGDGLTDLVRIRNGEVSYWPSLGHGRFGPRVVMDDAPWFDTPDQFDHARVRLADIDGSGTTDILYLHREGVRIYFNQSGNRWTGARRLRHLPPVDEMTAVTTADLLGNGTACLVWSSPLPADARAPVRYVDLMGGQKPHLLVRTSNNLGLTTEVTYAPSTKFYLADKRAGTPWVTRIPFPVHVVEQVTVSDRWRGTRFTTSYTYHHGHFDGPEREFRGFGRVEQVDAEDYGTFAAANAASPWITDDLRLHQPPIKTITWFHTGAMVDRRRILSQYASEYFAGFPEKELPEPDLSREGLTADEWREALRACKGMALRQEIYELDVDALAAGRHVPVKIYSAADHNAHIRMLQPRRGNRHAVFLVTESEAIRYHYELDLRASPAAADPRIAHSLNLRTDELGNPLQAVTVVYPRRGRHVDPALSAEVEARIAAVQAEMHVAYAETRYTGDVVDADVHRLRAPCEVTSFEVTGITPADGAYFTLGELRALRLSRVHQPDGAGLVEVAELPYHRRPEAPGPHRRLVDKVRTLFFADDLGGPLGLGSLGRLGLPFETYKLAMTDDLLSAIFSPAELAVARADLHTPAVSGYLGGVALLERFPDAAGEHWIRSGIAGFERDAAAHFYLPERYADAFGNTTVLAFDRDDLFVESSRDPLGNETRVLAFDHRVLAPTVLRDPNHNLVEATFDILGQPVAVAVRGKGDGAEGDDVGPIRADVMLAQPPPARAGRIFTGGHDEAELRRLLATATSRHVYWFGETVDPTDGTVRHGAGPAGACSVVRETHVADLEPGAASALQVGFEYSDGGGNVIARKQRAEPAEGSAAPRWLTGGKTVFNNKGKPVLEYEPYFSTNEHRFEELAAVGVTPVLYHDAAGRTVRTERPDGSYSRVELSPWHVTAHDPNDTVLEPDNPWYAARVGLPPGDPERRAAELAAAHAGTPSTVFLDSLGREVIAVAHNRHVDRRGAAHDDRLVTFTRLDAEGKPLWIRDPRGNLVMQYLLPRKPIRAADEPDPARADEIPAGAVPCYDVAGNLLAEHSMDAGGRRTLPDAAGQPMIGWDENVRITDDGAAVREERMFRTVYDAGRRPVERWLHIGDRRWMVERMVYGESLPEEDARARNLRGQLHQHHDPSGLYTNWRFDLDGALEEASRQLTTAVQAPAIDWSEGAADQLEREVFHRRMEHDALGRAVRVFEWHRDPGRVTVHESRFDERGLLAAQDLYIGARLGPSGERVGGRLVSVVSGLRRDEKGQRVQVVHGNGVVTRYAYDPLTFRIAQIRTTRPGHHPRFPDHRSGLRDEGVLQQLLYAYDAVGNVVEVRDEAYEPVYFRNQPVVPESLYTYDALYRLIRATGRESASAAHAPAAGPEPRVAAVSFPVTDRTLRRYTQHYDYDGAGNILEMAHVADRGSWSRTYEYAADSNRLLSTRTGNGARSEVTFEHDLHGCALNLGSAPAEYHLRWDFRDMIRSVDLGGGGTAYYNHDAARQRTRKVIHRAAGGGVRWERLYLGGLEIYRRRGAGGVTDEIETYHITVDGERVLMVDEVLVSSDRDLPAGTLFRYQHGNHLGSVSLELDDRAAIVSYEEYHPYGTSAYRARGAGVRATAKRYRYTGMERDEETGLAYHGARYYSCVLGTWLSADPIGVGGGQNLFRYAASSPLVLRDRSGRDPYADARSLRTAAENLFANNFSRADFEGQLAEAQGYEIPRNQIGRGQADIYNHHSDVVQGIQQGEGIQRRIRGFLQDLREANPDAYRRLRAPLERIRAQIGARLRIARRATAVAEALRAGPHATRLQRFGPPNGRLASQVLAAEGETLLPRGSVVAELAIDGASFEREIAAVPEGGVVGAEIPRAPTPRPRAQPAPEQPRVRQRPSAPRAPARAPARPRAVRPAPPPPQAPAGSGWGVQAMGYAGTALRFVGHAVTLLGAYNEAARTGRLEQRLERGPVNEFIGFTGTFVLTALAGVVDDALVVGVTGLAGSPAPVVEVYERHGAGPVQHAVGEGIRWLIRLDP